MPDKKKEEVTLKVNSEHFRQLIATLRTKRLAIHMPKWIAANH